MADRNWIPAKLILASASPRRSELLEAAGIAFDVVPAMVEERQRENESAMEFVGRIAAEKAGAVWERLPPHSRNPVLGADTVVVVDGETLGKPASAEDASRMLRLLSGKEHRVLTGVCLVCELAASPGQTGAKWKQVSVAATKVTFSRLGEEEIAEYVATGEPLDKAGAYAIQGRASKFVERIEGCYFNVVGLPVAMVYRMLQDLAAAIEKKRATFQL